jgi:hypothetical protein
MSIDEDTRVKALERARRAASGLAGISGVTSDDISRLVVEPLLTWLGWPVLDWRRVRRGRRLADGLPAAPFACFDRFGPVLAVFVTTRVSDVGLRDFQRWSTTLRHRGVAHGLYTDGTSWSALGPGADADVDGEADPVELTGDFLDISPLSVLSREHLSRASAPGPSKPDRPGTGPRPEEPRPADTPIETPSPRRTWDPTTYSPEVETWTKPRFVEFSGTRHAVQHWWQVVWHCANHHLAARGQLPAYLFPKQQGPYASRDPGALRRARLVNAGWYVEANLNAHLAHRIAHQLLLDARVARGEILVVFD